MAIGKALGDATAAIGKMSGGITKLHPGLAAVKLGLAAVSAALDRNAEFNKKVIAASERLSAMNMTTSKFLEENNRAIMENTAGINNSLAVAVELEKLGLTIGEQKTAFLAGLKMTGQNTKAAMQLFQGLEQFTDVTASEQEKLAAVFQETGRQFGRFGEDIVAAVAKLETKLASAAGLDVTANMALIAEATAKFGPTIGQQVAALANQLIPKTTEDLAKLAMFDLGGISEQFTKGQLDLEGLIEAVREGNMALDSMMAGQDEQFRVLNLQALGLGELAPLMNSLEARMKEAREANPDARGIDDTMAALRAQVSREAEFEALMVDGQRRMAELSIQANGALDAIAAQLQVVVDWLAETFGVVVTSISEATQEALMRATGYSIQEGIETRERLTSELKFLNASTAAVLDNSNEQNQMARQAQADRLEQTRAFGDLNRLLGFDISTAQLEVMERMTLHMESTANSTGRAAASARSMDVTQLLGN